MKILMLGRPGSERAAAAERLEADGHDVLLCRDHHWGCAGLEGTCPIDEAAVDVAVVTVEPDEPTDEQAVACAHRAHIPVVLVGAAPGDRLERHVNAAVAGPTGDLARALEVAASDTAAYRAAIEGVFAEHLGAGERAQVAVRRSPQRLLVELDIHAAPERRSTLADHARAAVRAYDRRTPVIDVVVVTSD
jgi:hypothetical protein